MGAPVGHRLPASGPDSDRPYTTPDPFLIATQLLPLSALACLGAPPPARWDGHTHILCNKSARVRHSRGCSRGWSLVAAAKRSGWRSMREKITHGDEEL